MPFDVDDPRCPECNGPVSATATYCMHCGEEFEEQVGSSGVSRIEPPGVEDAGGPILDPDGPIDGLLTVLVGVACGAIVGLLSLALFAFATQSVWSVVPGALAWLGATGYFATRDAVGRAFATACYATGLLLVLLPVIVLGPAAKGGSFVGQVVLFVVGELLFGAVALVLVGVGYSVGGE